MSETRITIGTKEAAAILGVSMPTIYEMVHMSGFPSIRVGRKILISIEGLKKWVEEQSNMVV